MNFLFGKDKEQEIGLKLTEMGITPLLIPGENDNGIVNSFVTPDNERTLQTYFGASMEFRQGRIVSQHFNDTSHVHLEGYLAYFDGVLERSLKLAEKYSASVSLDLSAVSLVEQFSEKLKNCVKNVDVVFGNLQEMQKLTGLENVSDIIKTFDSSQIVVITNGNKTGCIKPKGGFETIKFEAPQIDNPIDTTGAGDFFTGGFLAGLMTKKNIQTCISMAKLAASFVIQQEGAELPESKWSELTEQEEMI